VLRTAQVGRVSWHVPGALCKGWRQGAADLRAVADASGALGQDSRRNRSRFGFAGAMQACARQSRPTPVPRFPAAASAVSGKHLFPQGSYQSCIVPLVITVVTRSFGRVGPGEVKSTSDPKGFSVTLAAVAGAVATYADSILSP